MSEKFKTFLDVTKKNTLCKVLGHRESFVFDYEKNSKKFRVTTCSRCWNEDVKEVK